MKSLSFDPPVVPLDTDLTWLLRAAFADDASNVEWHDSERALQMARTTQLSGRVAARLGAWRGGTPASATGRGFSDDYYANVAKGTLLMQAHQEIARIAEQRKVPLIAVKFGALRLAGIIDVGARMVADLDILLPPARARELWQALLAAGFSRTNSHEYPHQLEALAGPHGAFIDLHVHLPGVLLERGGFATAEQLFAHGLLVPTSAGVLVPTASVLAAHAIAHGLVQNRSTPQTYSPLRMLADLMDLRRVEPEVLRNAASYLAPQLMETCHTLERLCLCLAGSRFDETSFAGTREQLLLRHCVAARLDFDYAERLRAGGLAYKFEDGSSKLDIARYLANLVYPAEAALDSLYGPARGTFDRIRRRLLRPVDLAVRAVHRSLRSRER